MAFLKIDNESHVTVGYDICNSEWNLSKVNSSCEVNGERQKELQ